MLPRARMGKCDECDTCGLMVAWGSPPSILGPYHAFHSKSSPIETQVIMAGTSSTTDH